jgi:hypothetical protein
MAFRRLGTGRGTALRRFRTGRAPTRRPLSFRPGGAFRPGVRLNSRAVTRRRSMFATRPFRRR